MNDLFEIKRILWRDNYVNSHSYSLRVIPNEDDIRIKNDIVELKKEEGGSYKVENFKVSAWYKNDKIQSASLSYYRPSYGAYPFYNTEDKDILKYLDAFIRNNSQAYVTEV